MSQLRRSPCGLAFTSGRKEPLSTLDPEVCKAANRGFEVFPDLEIARLTGRPELLIGEATSEISRLEEFAAEYPLCAWRVAVGQSGLCVLRVDGPQGRASLATLSHDQEGTLTLLARRGETTWAFFWRPKNLKLRVSAKRLALGVTVLVDHGSCPVPPSGGCRWANAWAEIEAVPCWLKELAFETPDSPPGKAVPAPVPSPRPVPCRSHARLGMPHRGTYQGYSRRNQVVWRWGHHVYRCR